MKCNQTRELKETLQSLLCGVIEKYSGGLWGAPGGSFPKIEASEGSGPSQPACVRWGLRLCAW